MTVKTQKNAVISTILSVLNDRGVSYKLFSEGGEQVLADVLNSDDKTKCREMLIAGFQSQTIEMSESAREKYADEKELKKYVSGLLNNWVRKHPDFNLGVKYKAKNPGSRTGQKDPMIKNLRLMLNQEGLTAEGRAEIQSAIDERLAEIKPKSAPKAVDVSQIPEHLRHLIGKTVQEGETTSDVE